MKQATLLVTKLVVTGVALFTAFAGNKTLNAAPDNSIKLQSGVTIRPLDVQQDKALTPLDLKIWRYEFSGLNGREGLNCQIALYRGGRFVRSIGGFQTDPAGELATFEGPQPLTIGLVALGENWGKAREVKCLTTIRGNSATLVSPNFVRSNAIVTWGTLPGGGQKYVSLMQAKHSPPKAGADIELRLYLKKSLLKFKKPAVAP